MPLNKIMQLLLRIFGRRSPLSVRNLISTFILDEYCFIRNGLVVVTWWTYFSFFFQGSVHYFEQELEHAHEGAHFCAPADITDTSDADNELSRILDLGSPYSPLCTLCNRCTSPTPSYLQSPPPFFTLVIMYVTNFVVG